MSHPAVALLLIFGVVVAVTADGSRSRDFGDLLMGKSTSGKAKASNYEYGEVEVHDACLKLSKEINCIGGDVW